MNYEFDFEQPNADAYDRRANGTPGARVGGLRHTPVGSFGIDRPAPEPIYATVTRKINPNFVLGGVIAVGGLWMLSSLVTSLGNANPNNQMLEASSIQAEAYKVMIESQSKAMEAVANQRPACIALVCNTSEPAQPRESEYQPQYVDELPIQQPPVVEGGEYLPSPSLPAPTATPTPIAVPTDAKTVAFWTHHMGDQPYIDEWHRFCSANWDIQPECQALRTALTNQFTHQ